LPEQLLDSHNGYEIQGLLGRGGLGQVYLVRCLEDNRYYALKVSGADALSAATLHREAQMLSAVEHPAFPDVREIWEEDECVYLVMTYIEGRTLSEMMEEQLQHVGIGFEADDVLPWMIQLAESLEYLSVHRMIYRDLKPSNVMIDEKGRVYLIDFGSVCYLGEDISAQGMGTPGFASPEQYSRSCGPGPWTDVYSFGALMHFLLTGEDPSQNLFHFKKLSEFLWLNTTSGSRGMRCQKIQIRRLNRLIESCTKTDPKKRCDWDEIRKALCFSGREGIRSNFLRLRRLVLGGSTVFLMAYGMTAVLYSRMDDISYKKHLREAETSEKEEAEQKLIAAIEQAPEKPAAYLRLCDSFMQDGILSEEEWQQIQHLLLENKAGKSDRDAAEWIILDYRIAMALYMQSEASISRKQAAVWFQAVADADMQNIHLGRFDDRKLIWQKRSGIFAEWCQISDQKDLRRRETAEEQRDFWRQAKLLLEDDFCFGEIQWELAMYDRILSRMMEEVSIGVRMKIVSMRDLDMVLDRIKLGLEQANNIAGNEAMKKQIQDKADIIGKRLVIGESED